MYDEREERIHILIEKISQGDIRSIQDFFELYSDDIYNFPLKFCNFSEDEAGDFYLYAFERLKNGKKLSSFQGKSKFKTWLFSVLRNLTIDFLRKRKEKIKVTHLMRVDSKGNLVDDIENISDISFYNQRERELFESFTNQLNEIKLSQRTLFKLVYIHYMDLEPEELEWLVGQNQKDESEIFLKILNLKEIALKKASEVKNFEDRLTTNFQSLLSLDSKIRTYFKENPEAPQERSKWSEFYIHPKLPSYVIEWIHTISKKKKKTFKFVISAKEKFALSTSSI